MILAIDRFVQRHFDRAAHAVMRSTGATKRQMRMHAWRAGSAYGVVCGFCGDPRYFITAGLLLALSFADSFSDQAAEHSGARSIADKPVRAAVFKVVGLGLACLWVMLVVRFDQWLRGIDSFLLLYQGYLCGTSPEVPDREPAATVLRPRFV